MMETLKAQKKKKAFSVPVVRRDPHKSDSVEEQSVPIMRSKTTKQNKKNSTHIVNKDAADLPQDREMPTWENSKQEKIQNKKIPQVNSKSTTKTFKPLNDVECEKDKQKPPEFTGALKKGIGARVQARSLTDAEYREVFIAVINPRLDDAECEKDKQKRREFTGGLKKGSGARVQARSLTDTEYHEVFKAVINPCIDDADKERGKENVEDHDISNIVDEEKDEHTMEHGQRKKTSTVSKDITFTVAANTSCTAKVDQSKDKTEKLTNVSDHQLDKKKKQKGSLSKKGKNKQQQVRDYIETKEDQNKEATEKTALGNSNNNEFVVKENLAKCQEEEVTNNDCVPKSSDEIIDDDDMEVLEIGLPNLDSQHACKKKLDQDQEETVSVISRNSFDNSSLPDMNDAIDDWDRLNNEIALPNLEKEHAQNEKLDQDLEETASVISRNSSASSSLPENMADVFDDWDSQEEIQKMNEHTPHDSDVEDVVEPPAKIHKPKKAQQKKGMLPPPKKKSKLQPSVLKKFHCSDLEEPSADKGTWVQCCKMDCKKWRYLATVFDPAEVDENWICSMHPDSAYNNCDKAEQDYDESDHILTQYTLGSLVWAKMDGFPWWPAIVDIDPDYDTYCEIPDENSMIPTDYHVVFLDENVTRCWVKKSRIQHLTAAHLEPKSRFVNVQKYKREVGQSIKKAETALRMTLKERLDTFGFAARFNNQRTKWTKVFKKKTPKKCVCTCQCSTHKRGRGRKRSRCISNEDVQRGECDDCFDDNIPSSSSFYSSETSSKSVTDKKEEKTKTFVSKAEQKPGASKQPTRSKNNESKAMKRKRDNESDLGMLKPKKQKFMAPVHGSKQKGNTDYDLHGQSVEFNNQDSGSENAAPFNTTCGRGLPTDAAKENTCGESKRKPAKRNKLLKSDSATERDSEAKIVNEEKSPTKEKESRLETKCGEAENQNKDNKGIGQEKKNKSRKIAERKRRFDVLSFDTNKVSSAKAQEELSSDKNTTPKKKFVAPSIGAKQPRKEPWASHTAANKRKHFEISDEEIGTVKDTDTFSLTNIGKSQESRGLNTQMSPLMEKGDEPYSPLVHSKNKDQFVPSVNSGDEEGEDSDDELIISISEINKKLLNNDSRKKVDCDIDSLSLELSDISED